MTAVRGKRGDLAVDAMVALMRASARLMRRLEDVCGEHGITHDQYNVLRILRGAHPTGHPRYEVAERLISRAPDVTRLLDRLEGEGLVERYRSEEDRRLSISRITDRGMDLLRQMDPRVHELHDGFSGGLNREELVKLSELCGRLGA